MTLEQIKTLAEALELDPKRLVIKESWYDPLLEARRYDMEYTTPDKIYDFHFLIESFKDVDTVEDDVVFYVNKGLREIAQAAIPGEGNSQ